MTRRLEEGGNYKPQVSVIIPILNEEGIIGRCLEQFTGIPGNWEMIVVDGGSKDRSREIVKGYLVKLLASLPGRARQMNVGARQANGEILLFLHADTLLPPNAYSLIENLLRTDRKTVAGCFKIRTVPECGRPLLFRTFVRLADIRSRLTRYPYGDQAIFVRKEGFQRLNGYREMPIMEDYDLSLRLRKLGSLKTLDACVTVSARRFENRLLRSTVLMKTIPLLYRLGVSPERLVALYSEER